MCPCSAISSELRSSVHSPRDGEQRDQPRQRLDVCRDGGFPNQHLHAFRDLFSRPSAKLIVWWQLPTPQARYALSRMPDSSGEQI